MSTDIWDKYRHESDQTITIIGVLILSAKLCVADKHFSIKEEKQIPFLILEINKCHG